MAETNVYAHTLGNKAAQALLADRYDQLPVCLTTLAKASNRLDLVEKIEGIKKKCFDDTGFKYRELAEKYNRSFIRSAMRAVVFSTNGRRVPYGEVREMGEVYIVEPINDVFVELIGKLGETQDEDINKALESLGKTAPSTLENKMPNVVFDE